MYKCLLRPQGKLELTMCALDSDMGMVDSLAHHLQHLGADLKGQSGQRGNVELIWIMGNWNEGEIKGSFK